MNTSMVNGKILVLFLSCMLGVSFAQAKKVDFDREIKKSFDINRGALLDIDCSFSEVYIETHSDSRIDVQISISVDTGSEDKAQKMFDRIIASAKGSQSHVEVETGLNKGNSNNDFDIIVRIKAPSHINLKSNVAFGQLEIDEIEGSANITQEYGELKAKALRSSSNDVSVSFGDGWIEEFNGGEISVEFGSCEVEVLNGNAEISSSYSDVEVEWVKPSCSKLDLSCSFGDLEVNLDESCSFTIEASASMGDVSLDREIDIQREKNDWNSESYEATLGNGSGRLEAECSFGDLNINVR